MALDIYSTYAQLAAIEQMPRENSFLWDMFVKEEGVVEEDKAFYDFRKGIIQMAPIVHENTGGVLMGRGGYETRMIDFCTIAPERIVEANQLKNRFFGEKVFGAMTPAQREKKMLAQDQIDMRKAIQRRREGMARQLILTGKLDIFTYSSEGKSKTSTCYADFGFTNKFTPETAWNQVGATIEADMRSITDLVYNGGGEVEVIVMAPDVADAMYANEAYVNAHNIRNMDIGYITSVYKGAGVRYMGKNSDGIDMYSFSGKFMDDDGLTKPVIPSGTLIAGGRNMLKCFHGPVIQVEKEDSAAQHLVYVKREVPFRHGDVNGNNILNRITSRPALMPYNVDGWAVADVL